MEDKPFLESRGSVLLRVRANPGASEEGLQGLHGNALKVAVQAPPKRGKANSAIRKVLARAFGLPVSQVSLESGETSREKRFRLEGIPLKELEDRLRVLLRTSEKERNAQNE